MCPAMRELLLISCLGLCACPPRPIGVGTGGTKVEVKKDATADGALGKAISVADSKSRKEGIEALLLVRKTYPETTAGQDALYRAGVLAFEEGDYALARKSLGELLFENPLHPKANDARLKSGLAAVEQKAYRDAFQTLSTLVDRLEGEDKKLAEAALVRAAAGSQQYGEALKGALKGVDAASGPDELKKALANLEDVVETKTTFLSVAEAWNELPKSHPGWPLITFKMARVFYHLRDWTRLDETLKSLLSTAPDSVYAPEGKALQLRLSKRSLVKPKVIGAVLPMTGKYKAFGETTLRGLQLALKGSDIELIVKDTQGDPSLTSKLVEQLAFDDGVLAIIGPLLAEDAKRGALVAEELQVPLLTLSRADGLTEIGPHIFRTMVTNAQQAEALADYAMTTLGYKTFAILHPNTPFGVELSNEFWDAIEKRGGQIRGVESYDHDQKTFTEEAKRLAGRYYLEDRADYYEKIREIREATTDEFRRRKAMDKMKAALEPVIDFEAMLIPDSWQQVSLVAPALAVEDIITNACDKKDLERIQKTTGKDKLKTVTLLGPSTWSSPKGTSGDPQLMERGGKYVLCSVYVEAFYETSDRPSTKAFVAAFREAYKDASITLLDAVGFDSGAMVRNIIEKTAPNTRSAFRETLQHLKDFQGATGSLTMDDAREARRQLYLLNITPKGVKEVTPRRPEG